MKKWTLEALSKTKAGGGEGTPPKPQTKPASKPVLKVKSQLVTEKDDETLRGNPLHEPIEDKVLDRIRVDNVVYAEIGKGYRKLRFHNEQGTFLLTIQRIS